MPVNPYIKYLSTASEQNLTNDLTVEAIKFFGIDLLYIPRSIVNIDPILNEDVLAKFEEVYEIECYIETPAGFTGKNDFLSKWGIQMEELTTIIVSKTRFKEITALSYPREGDLIYFPLNKSLFEVSFVEHERHFGGFYQIGKGYTFQMSVKLFRYSNEIINTSCSSIDDFQKKYFASTSTTTDGSEVLSDPYAQNKDFHDETRKDNQVNWSENNPFGNPG